MYQRETAILFDMSGFILFTFTNKTDDCCSYKYTQTILGSENVTSSPRSCYENGTQNDELFPPLKCLYKSSKEQSVFSIMDRILGVLFN